MTLCFQESIWHEADLGGAIRAEVQFSANQEAQLARFSANQQPINYSKKAYWLENSDTHGPTIG